MKVLSLSYFEKQKKFVLALQKIVIKRKTDVKKDITSANERDKAHFKRV